MDTSQVDLIYQVQYLCIYPSKINKSLELETNEYSEYGHCVIQKIKDGSGRLNIAIDLVGSLDAAVIH